MSTSIGSNVAPGVAISTGSYVMPGAYFPRRASQLARRTRGAACELSEYRALDEAVPKLTH